MNIFHLSKFQKGHWDISGRRKIAPRAKIVTVAAIKFLTQSKLYVLKRNISWITIDSDMLSVEQ